MPLKYTNVAIILHWLIAIAIILQLAAGAWMVGAIKDAGTRSIAFDFYQYHKSVGLAILTLSIFRLAWRLAHKHPALPSHMKKWEIFAANASHATLYFLMIAIPFIGWAMVSTSPLGFPTIIFNLFEWPHIAFLSNLEGSSRLNELFTNWHKNLAYLMAILILAHIGAALKHQFIDKDGLILRMIPSKK